MTLWLIGVVVGFVLAAVVMASAFGRVYDRLSRANDDLRARLRWWTRRGL